VEPSAFEATGPLDAPTIPPSAIDATRFAHASEAEMARILDFYQVRWEYEPTTFPILWNLDGEVIESFAPDFYLPDLEVFLEMTTLRQRLVRKKNRKLRRLRELYPDIRIKLFYARDFRAMMLKYGRLGLAESLSGTPGQVVPDRSPAAGVMADSEIQAAVDAASPVAVELGSAGALNDDRTAATSQPPTRATTRTIERRRARRRRRARAARDTSAAASEESTG
jgi:hypoxanthine phosphoribosyltransferase